MAYRRTPEIQARIDGQRVAIVDAAATLLAERGYAGCSIAAVAARAGVAAGTVYRHFDSKTELVAEVFRSVVGREVAAVRAAVDGEAGVEQRVAAVVQTFAARALKSPRLAYALLTEPVDPVIDELRLEYRRTFRDIAASAIADGVRGGSLPPQNADVVAAALVGAIAEALAGPLASGAEDPETVPTLIRFAYRAIGARPEE
ncbi:MAG TPA: TetR/AcrR family transcriptional regulator [Jatrophihabitantaceae bacterium]|nr:TetR/AcrR family transcriptional regulator [Jatrophihabitantaceae bacterium]